jgi:hypothetical protein
LLDTNTSLASAIVPGIEGYAVTPELIEKVSRGGCPPETITQDNDAKNTLAARGYYEAFNQVK